MYIIGHYVGYYAGFFAIMALCMICAILTARTRAGVVFLIGGAIVQIVAITSKEKQNLFAGDTTTDWIVFFSLLALGIIFVFLRRAKH